MTNAANSPADLVTLRIDDKEVRVAKGTLLVEAAKQVNVDVPVFCYHDRLAPVGACRMCLVEIEKMPRLQTACTTPVSDGMVVRTDSEHVRQGREGVLSLLLSNHPLDCPVCDKGGECPLQDNTFRYGPGIALHREERTHKEKAFELSERIILDRERCIMCYRCVRFHDEVAGDRALAVVNRGGRGEIGVPAGTSYDSPFSGNTVDLCPVGALTSRAYRFRARPWDLKHANGICVGCGVGCNVSGDSRDGRLLRLVPRENRDVNDVWLCDRGRFDTVPPERQSRALEPLVRTNGRLEPASWSDALSRAARVLGAGPSAALVGGALSNEAYGVLSAGLRPLLPGGVALAQGEGTDWPARGELKAIERSRAIVLVGLDAWQDMPVLALWIRRATLAGAKLLLIGEASGLAREAASVVEARPGEERVALAQLLAALSGEGGPLASAAALLQQGPTTLLASPRVAADVEALALLKRLADELPEAEAGLVGAPGRGANARGAVEILGPASSSSRAQAELLKRASEGAELYAFLTVEAELPADVEARAQVSMSWRPPAEDSRVDIFLPLAHPYEQSGSFTSFDGRPQSFDALGMPMPSPRPDFGALAALASAHGVAVPDDLRRLRRHLAEASPLYRALPKARTELRLA